MVAVLLLTAACGDGDPERSADKQRVEAVGLEDAFATAAGASSYRITQSSGQTLSSSALGVDNETEIDEDHPTVVAEVAGTSSHMRVDLLWLLGPLADGELDSAGFEMSGDPDRLVVDSRGYAGIKELNPDADLGPFEPGVSFVDLDVLRVDSPDLIAALVGQGLPDLTEMAKRLPQVLHDVEQNGTTYTGTAPYTDLMAAMGQDIEQIARFGRRRRCPQLRHRSRGTHRRVHRVLRRNPG